MQISGLARNRSKKPDVCQRWRSLDFVETRGGGTRAEFATYEWDKGSYFNAGATIHLLLSGQVARESEILRHFPSYTFRRETYPGLIETGQTGRHDFRIATHIIHIRICDWRAKNFACRTMDTVTGRNNTVCKVSGITLNYNAKQLVNFEVIRDMILGTGDHTANVHTERKIKRKRKGGELYPVT